MSSEYRSDLSALLGTSNTRVTPKHNTNKTSVDLDMTDFLTLMVVQLQNQSIDDTADTSQMLNQMVQMQMISALTNMTDASIMSYASSLVGKEVTVMTYDGNKPKEEIIEVMGTGTYGGEQVIFSKEGNMYHMNEIMAVGRLPEKVEETEESAETGGTKDPAESVKDPENNPEPPADKPVENTGESGKSDPETGLEKPDQKTEPPAAAEAM